MGRMRHDVHPGVFRSLTFRYRSAMLLVRVGSHTINVDHVAAFIEKGDATDVVFAVPQPKGASDGLFTLTLDGEASRQLRHWISRNAESGKGHPAGFSMLSDDE